MLFLMGILSVDLIITAFKIAQKADHHMDYPCKDLDLSRIYIVFGGRNLPGALFFGISSVP